MYDNIRPIKSKYKNRKVQVDGIIFDSAKEANRYKELDMMEKAGKIKDLKRQERFLLIPAQREESKGKKKGKLIERECAYVADFVYTDCETGEKVVEDVKGYRGGGAYEIFKIKRKLMLFKYGIRVKEV
jgi:hypothetical protein